MCASSLLYPDPPSTLQEERGLHGRSGFTILVCVKLAINFVRKISMLANNVTLTNWSDYSHAYSYCRRSDIMV